MTKQILDMEAFLENLTDSVRLEEFMVEKDPGGRLSYQLADAGIFFGPDSEPPKIPMWIPSEELWEKQSVEAMQQEEIERAKQLENQEIESGNSPEHVATKLSR